MKDNKSGWQFPKALEIIKCKEGNKEFMKERPARRPFGNTVLICEYPIDDTAAEEPNAKLITWRLAKRAARDFLRVSFMPSAMKGDAMKNKPSSGKRVAKRRFFKADERFATKAVIVIAITTAAFIVAQYVSFLITRQEQTVLIEWYFRAVVIECGAMMMKRLAEVIVGRIKKKEKIDIAESEDTNNDY